MKTFNVLITAYKAVIINAEDKESAEQIASEECFSTEWETERWEAEELESPEAIKRAQSHGAVLLNNWNG